MQAQPGDAPLRPVALDAVLLEDRHDVASEIHRRRHRGRKLLSPGPECDGKQSGERDTESTRTQHRVILTLLGSH